MTTTLAERVAPETATESWRITWRDGFAPVLPAAGLEALAAALEADDPRLTQGSTTTPPPLMCVQDWPCEAADAIGLCGVAVLGGFADEKPTGRHTNPGAARVGQVEEFFARACFDCDQRLGEPAACRWFLNAWDDMPRAEIFAELLAEVKRELARRKAVETTGAADPGASGLGQPGGLAAGDAA
jgi:hypothetical protein